jgi:hypothetical protein
MYVISVGIVYIVFMQSVANYVHMANYVVCISLCSLSDARVISCTSSHVVFPITERTVQDETVCVSVNFLPRFWLLTPGTMTILR